MDFTEQYIIEIASHYYQLGVEAKALNGYDELNFLLKDKNGEQYILKVATEEHGYHFLDAQVKIVTHLSHSKISDKFQQYLLNTEGNEITTLLAEEKNYFIRILSFLQGTFWVDLPAHPDSLLKDLGSFLGEMDLALQNFYHPAMCRQYVWDIKNALDARAHLSYIRSHEQRRIAAYFLLQFETEVLPHLSSLRMSSIHNDANDYNVLVKADKIAGLIDFGDMVYSQLINNLAVACTYAMFGASDPLHAAIMIVREYHKKYPLTELEISLLYYLIAGRLCISVCKSAFNAMFNSDNEHHFITEQSAWQLLHQLIKINPLKANHAFRMACGFSSIINEDDDYHQILAERKKHIGRNLSISYKKNVKIVRGALQYLYDDSGNTYIDCVNNVSHVGHCHPVVVKAMQKQIATLNTNTRYLHDAIVEYAMMLTATLPKELSVCYFTNSGSEANDLAIRMSRHFTKQKDVIVLDHAYHGTSTTAIELSPYKFDGKGGFGKMPYIHKAKNPDQYRGEFRYADKDAGKKYAADVQRIINELKKENKAPAAFICETLLGVGGQIPLPDKYLKDVYSYVKSAGGVCIADEVQVGFGRVGEYFWGFELQEVIPDMVVLGKPMGNGHPLAAVVVTPAIADAFNNGMEYFNTFGGNPVSMSAGIAVLKTIQEEELQQHALEVGNHLMDGLKRLMNKHPVIGDVRGHGLFIGVEMIRNQKTLEPAVPEIDYAVEKMKDRGFFISTDGPLHNVLKIKPPLVFTIENADELTKNLDEVLSEIQ
ncbi:MAG: aminotransferase class III-fold pyridoxal phosphate-dependent enzyme [Chitinophagaceae bacterium]